MRPGAPRRIVSPVGRAFAMVSIGVVSITVAACTRPAPDVAVVSETTLLDGAVVEPSGGVTSMVSTTTSIGTTTTTTTPRTTTTTTTTTTPPTTTTTTTLPPLGPGESLFPDRRVVALYGNDAASVLGVLGEQSPSDAVERLQGVTDEWVLSDRPVQGAFELIATLATASPGDGGLYRSRSTDAHVQRYLDVVEEHGLILILDIQPGRSDLLTEVRHYEEFLRHPNVHVALDPEWRVGPDERPGRGFVGQVDAAEVNAVADYLAAIVADEGLPDKLLVVHQFQSRMVVDRDQLVEPVGVTLTIHMDGFGTQEQKLDTYRVVHAEPPWNNGFKLFYDEDIDRFEPSALLAIDPAPDMISYQ